jgi:regulator of replication initiation timing
MTINGTVTSESYRAMCERISELDARLAAASATIVVLQNTERRLCRENELLRLERDWLREVVSALRAELARCRRDWNEAEREEAKK